MVDGRPLPVDGLVLRPATDQAVQVAGLELVGVGSQRCQVSDPVAAGAGGEDVVEGQRGQDREATGAATLDGQALGVDPAGVHQVIGDGYAVVHVQDPPTAPQAVAVGAAVAGGAPVVDVGHGEAAAGPVGDGQLELGPDRAGRTSVGQHQQRRQLAVGSPVVGAGRRVDDGIRHLTAGRGKGERLGLREPAGVNPEVPRPAQDSDTGGFDCDHGRLGGPTGDHGDDPVAGRHHGTDRGGRTALHRNGDLLRRAVGPPHGQVVNAHLPSCEPDVVPDEGIAGQAEHPLRRGHLELTGGQRMQGPGTGVDPVEVPPAAPVGDHVQHAVGPPFGLEERLALGGHAPPAGQGAPVRSDGQVGHPEFGVVPGQLRVVPLDPGQPQPIRRDPRGRHEVGTGDQHVDLH